MNSYDGLCAGRVSKALRKVPELIREFLLFGGCPSASHSIVISTNSRTTKDAHRRRCVMIVVSGLLFIPVILGISFSDLRTFDIYRSYALSAVVSGEARALAEALA